MSGSWRQHWKAWLPHAALVTLALVPLALIVRDALAGRLGANPIEKITHRTGDWTLRLLLATLAITPLRWLTGWNAVIRYRRTLGLLAFSYVCVHFLIYLVLDQGFPVQGFALGFVAADIAKRPYITVGFTAFLLLWPLALTSSRNSIRRLGGRRWNALHRLIYVAAALGTLHFMWSGKGKNPTPVYYALVLILLLVVRVWQDRVVAKRAGAAHAPPPSPLTPPLLT